MSTNLKVQDPVLLYLNIFDVEMYSLSYIKLHTIISTRGQPRLLVIQYVNSTM